MNALRIERIDSPTAFHDPYLRQRAQQACTGKQQQFVALQEGTQEGFVSYDDHPILNLGVIYEVLVLKDFRNRGIG